MITALSTALVAGITIVLPMEAPVRGSEIELGEIATIQGATPEQLELLEDLELGRSPSAGYDRILQPADIRAKVKRVLPGQALSFAGRRVCRAFLETKAVTPTMIGAAVDRELAAAVGGRDVTWTAPKLGTLELPLGQDGSEPTIEVVLGSGDVTSGPLEVEVRLKVEGLTYKTVYGRWDVTVWETLPVLTRNLPAGSRVSPAHFELRRTGLPAGGRGVVLSPASMQGAIAMRNLVEGSLVTDRDVERQKVVHEGEQLTLLVRKGSIEARVRVIARASASIGDRIRVQRLDGDRELYAVVRSKELVELDLDV